MMTSSSDKECTLCHEVKASSEFRRKSKALDGLDSWCKSCAGARDRAYYAANSDAIKARVKAWEQANPERYIRNQRSHYQANAEKKRAAAKAWKKANPEAARASDEASGRARRAIKRGRSAGPIDYEALWTGFCGICSEPIDRAVPYPEPMSKSVDHKVPLSRGGNHTQENLQWAHLSCNLSKGNRIPDIA